MGSFRSQPDLKKHTEYNRGLGLEYVSTHMCGKNIFLCRLENLYGRRTYCSVTID